MAIEEKVVQNQGMIPSETPKTKTNWDILPCEGIFRLSSKKENITFSYCNAPYWECPNKKCIMQLV